MAKPIQRRVFLRGAFATATALCGAAIVRAEDATHQIVIDGFAFAPDDLQITVGDSVSWINRDAAPHTVSDIDEGFESGTLRKGESFAMAFLEPGRYGYICKFHPKMKATIIVSR